MKWNLLSLIWILGSSHVYFGCVDCWCKKVRVWVEGFWDGDLENWRILVVDMIGLGKDCTEWIWVEDLKIFLNEIDPDRPSIFNQQLSLRDYNNLFSLKLSLTFYSVCPQYSNHQ